MARGALLPLRRRLGEEHFSDLRVVISELVANATAHGHGDEIRLSITVDGDDIVRGRIEDDGGPKRIEPNLDIAAVDEGLGLLIVDTLATAWGSEASRPGVWFEIEPPIPVTDTVTTGRRLGEELSGLHSRIFGGSAQSVEVLLADDAVVVLLEGAMTESAGAHPEAAIDASFRAAVERLLGRTVDSFSTFMKPDGNCACLVFRLAPLQNATSWVRIPA